MSDEAHEQQGQQLQQLGAITLALNDVGCPLDESGSDFILRQAQQLAALQLHWSTAKPTVPGQHWWRAGADIGNPECMYVEHIRLWKGQLVNAYTLEPPEDGEWAGPLVPPEEAR